MNLPPYLVEFQQVARAHAESYNLDFFDVIFEMVSTDELNMMAAYGGFPYSLSLTGGLAWTMSVCPRATSTVFQRFMSL